MANSEQERILSLRNQTSMLLDDLVALVTDSALAAELRNFSNEVMEKKPGIAFTMRQARELKEITERALRQYASGAIRDEDLVQLPMKAQTILQGQSLMNGGKQMGLLDKVFHGKEIARKENLDQLERQYRNVCEDILNCEKEMARCVEESRGVSPNSMTYRDHERTYMADERKLQLLQKQEGILRKTLDEAGRMEEILQFEKSMAAIQKATNIVLGGENSFRKAIAKAELNTEKVKGTVERFSELGNELYESDESETSRTSNSFGAKVAEEERRYNQLENEGRAGFGEKEKEEPRSTFASLVEEKED